jgi:hypothetical protein
MGRFTIGPFSGSTETDKTMLTVILTIWLLLQLPVALLLARLIACPQKRQAMRCRRQQAPAFAPDRARAA